MVGASKSWNEHGGCIRALVRLARKLDIFLPLRVIGRGRGEERDGYMERGHERKRAGGMEEETRREWKEIGKPRSRKHFST